MTLGMIHTHPPPTSRVSAPAPLPRQFQRLLGNTTYQITLSKHLASEMQAQVQGDIHLLLACVTRHHHKDDNDYMINLRARAVAARLRLGKTFAFCRRCKQAIPR